MKKTVYPIICLGLTLSSCSYGDDQHFDFPAMQGRELNFTMCNVSFESGAVATPWFSMYGDEVICPRGDRDNMITFDVPYDFINWDGDTIGNYGRATREIKYVNSIWGTWGCTFEFTFHPSCTEEAEAVFSFPDGTSATATASHPIVRWTMHSLNELSIVDEYWNPYTYVTAESRYKVGLDSVHSKGFVCIEFGFGATFENKIYHENGRFYYNERELENR